MTAHDNPTGNLYELITSDLVHAQERRVDEPGLVGGVAFPTFGPVEAANLVRAVLDVAAKTFGDELAGLVLAHKDQIRTLIGPGILALTDTVIHGLQDLKAADDRP